MTQKQNKTEMKNHYENIIKRTKKISDDLDKRIKERRMI